MVSREQLKRGGLRAYETGRLLVAARPAWVLVPAVLVCALETGAAKPARASACCCSGQVSSCGGAIDAAPTRCVMDSSPERFRFSLA